MRMAATPEKMAAVSARGSTRMAGATLGVMRLRLSLEPEGEKGGLGMTMGTRNPSTRRVLPDKKAGME